METVSGKYILDPDGQPQLVEDVLEWARWLETSNTERIVVQTELDGDILISTVFLALDHSFGRELQPILWETMIFGGPHDGYQERYTSHADAEAGHRRAVSLATT